jgi:hypothetical protein
MVVAVVVAAKSEGKFFKLNFMRCSTTFPFNMLIHVSKQQHSTAAERGQCTNLISTYGEENEREKRKRDGTDASISA